MKTSKITFFQPFLKKNPLNFQWKLLPEGAVTTKIWQQFFWLGFWKAGPNFQFLKLPIFAFFSFFEYSRTAWEKKIVQSLTLLVKAHLHIFTGNISILWEPACEQTAGTFSHTRVGGSWKKSEKILMFTFVIASSTAILDLMDETNMNLNSIHLWRSGENFMRFDQDLRSWWNFWSLRRQKLLTHIYSYIVFYFYYSSNLV